MADFNVNTEALPPHLLKPFSKKAMSGGIAFLLLLAAGGSGVIWLGLCSELTLHGLSAILVRLVFVLCGSSLLFLPFRLVWLSIRRKWTTGKWGPSVEERIKHYAKAANPTRPAWLMFVPSWLKNDSSDPTGTKLSEAAFSILITVATITLTIQWHQRGLNLFSPALLVFLSAHSIWDLYREPKSKGAAASTQT